MTVQEFYNKYKGKYVTAYGKTSSYLQWNDPYGGQCASLVRQYLVQVCGYPDRPYGNGKDFVNIPNGKIVSKPQNGDIIVFPNMTEWGHVAIYLDGKMFDQNPDKAKLHTIYSGKKIYIRPKGVKVTVAKPVGVVTYVTENGNIRKMNRYKSDTLEKVSAQGYYNYLMTIGTNGARNVFDLKGKKQSYKKKKGTKILVHK